MRLAIAYIITALMMVPGLPLLLQWGSTFEAKNMIFFTLYFPAVAAGLAAYYVWKKRARRV